MSRCFATEPAPSAVEGRLHPSLYFCIGNKGGAPSFALFAKEPALSAVEGWGPRSLAPEGVEEQCPTSRKTGEKWGTLMFCIKRNGPPA